MPLKDETLIRTRQIDRWMQVKDGKRRRTDPAVIENNYIINADGAELKPNRSVAELDWGGQQGARLILFYLISRLSPKLNQPKVTVHIMCH